MDNYSGLLKYMYVYSHNVCPAQNLQQSSHQESAKDIDESKSYELPPELWINIFKYLPQYELFKTIRLVCSAWRELVEDAMGPDYWQIIEFKETDVKPPFLVYLLQRSNNIQSLCLFGSTVSCTGLILALKQMRWLKELFLGYCNCNCFKCYCDPRRYRISTYEHCMCLMMTPVRTPHMLIPNGALHSDTLATIGEYCPQLTCLDLTGQQKLTNHALHAIVCGCKDLTHLNLMAAKGFTSSGIKAIADNCASLRELNLDMLSFIFYRVDLERLANGCPNLQCLSLRGIRGKNFPDHLLKLRNFKNLRRLNVYLLEALNDDVSINLAKHFKELHGNNWRKTVQVVRAVTQNFPHKFLQS